MSRSAAHFPPFEPLNMTEKEKLVLRKAIDSKQGQLSPVDMISGCAGGDQGAVEALVSKGYLERIYQFREGLHNATYSIIFYAVTEKGYVVFAPTLNRIWFNFKAQTAVWVGLISVIVSIGALVSTLYFGYKQNQRDSEEFVLRNRPYLVLTTTEAVNLILGRSADFRATIKNAGAFPALITRSAIACGDEIPTNSQSKTVIANGEHMTFVFSIASNLGAGGTCRLLFSYVTVGLSKDKVYDSQYDVKFTKNGEVIISNAIIR